MTRVLVTGARGFVGRHVVAELARAGVDVLAASRSGSDAGTVAGKPFRLEAGASDDELRGALSGVDAVVHLAAAVHDISGRTQPAEFARVNRDFTLRLAQASTNVGVKRFVFSSTIKVHGDGSADGAPLTEDSPIRPQGAYAESKWQAEEGLRELAARTGLEIAIVRPPLVYGPGVRANFFNLMRAVGRRMPLPFATLNNRRSLVYVENLANGLASLAVPAGGNGGSGTYLVSDGEDLSTPELIRRIAQALHVRPVLLPVPLAPLEGVLRALGKGDAVLRLFGSLCVDSARLRQHPWAPPHSVNEGLRRTAVWYEGLK